MSKFLIRNCNCYSIVLRYLSENEVQPSENKTCCVCDVVKKVRQACCLD